MTINQHIHQKIGKCTTELTQNGKNLLVPLTWNSDHTYDTVHLRSQVTPAIRPMPINNSVDCKIIKTEDRNTSWKITPTAHLPSFTAIPEPSFIFKTILKKKYSGYSCCWAWPFKNRNTSSGAMAPKSPRRYDAPSCYRPPPWDHSPSASGGASSCSWSWASRPRFSPTQTETWWHMMTWNVAKSQDFNLLTSSIVFASVVAN